MIITYTDSARRGKCAECGKSFIRRAIDEADYGELCRSCYLERRAGHTRNARAEKKPTDAVREFAERYERRIAELKEQIAELQRKAAVLTIERDGFFDDAKRAHDLCMSWHEKYIEESWHCGYQRMELAWLNAKLNGYTEPRHTLVGKDGKPIKRGQTLYGGDGRAWKIERFDGTYLWTENDGQRLKPEWLTHEQPDSWERIAELEDKLSESPAERTFRNNKDKWSGLAKYQRCPMCGARFEHEHSTSMNYCRNCIAELRGDAE